MPASFLNTPLKDAIGCCYASGSPPSVSWTPPAPHAHPQQSVSCAPLPAQGQSPRKIRLVHAPVRFDQGDKLALQLSYTMLPVSLCIDNVGSKKKLQSRKRSEFGEVKLEYMLEFIERQFSCERWIGKQY